LAGEIVSRVARPTQRTASKGRAKKIYQLRRNIYEPSIVGSLAASVAFKRFLEGMTYMTIRTRIALGITAAALSFSLALAPTAFAQDKMGKDDGMKKDTMSKDGMKKDTMSKDTMSHDGMKKDGMMKDGMKKDDGMKK
jgi:pentapeptide MXKDX repeat protein